MTRNRTLDMVKGIACISVVFFHVPFPGTLGMIISSITRFSVPFFFMVSGYYSFHSDGYNHQKNLKHIAFLLKIIVICSLVYLPANYLFKAWGDTVNNTMNDVGSLSIQGILQFLIFNQPLVIVGQLWFLFALLYDYLLFEILEKKKLINKAYSLIPILIIVYIFLAQGFHIAHLTVPNYVYRNFLIEGLPFFLIGHFIRFKENGIKIEISIVLLVLFIFSVGAVVERKILGRSFGVNICTFPQVIAIFLLCIMKPEWGSSNIVFRILTSIGEKFSLFVYVIHPFIWRMVNYLYKQGMQSWTIHMDYIKPVIVLGASIIIAFVFRKLLRFST